MQWKHLKVPAQIRELEYGEVTVPTKKFRISPSNGKYLIKGLKRKRKKKKKSNIYDGVDGIEHNPNAGV